MSVLSIGALAIAPHQLFHNEGCDCSEARHGCMPTFVFSVEGQVAFREALRHLTECRKSRCAELRRQVVMGMRTKLTRLFDESALLGCVHVQPYLYGANVVRFQARNFGAVAHHLAHCPKESCARLRRALLLNVRDEVSPNARN